MAEKEPTEDTPLLLQVPAEEPQPLPLATVAANPHAGFYQPNATIVEGTWGGMPAYRCSACPYDSLERTKTQAHLSIHGQTFTQGARP